MLVDFLYDVQGGPAHPIFFRAGIKCLMSHQKILLIPDSEFIHVSFNRILICCSVFSICIEVHWGQWCQVIFFRCFVSKSLIFFTHFTIFYSLITFFYIIRRSFMRQLIIRYLLISIIFILSFFDLLTWTTIKGWVPNHGDICIRLTLVLFLGWSILNPHIWLVLLKLRTRWLIKHNVRIDTGIFHSIQRILMLPSSRRGTGRDNLLTRAPSDTQLPIVRSPPGENLFHLVAQDEVLAHRLLFFSVLRH